MHLSPSAEIPVFQIRNVRRSALAKAITALASDIVAGRPHDQTEAAVQLAFSDLLNLEKEVAAHNNARTTEAARR